MLKEGDKIVTHSPVKKVPVDGEKSKKRKTSKRNSEKNRRNEFSKRQRGKNRRNEYRQSYTRKKIIFSPRYRDFCTEKTISDDNATAKSIPKTNNATAKSIPTNNNATAKSIPTNNNATAKSIPTNNNATAKSIPTTTTVTTKLIPTTIVLNSEDSFNEDSYEHREDEQKSLKNVTFLVPLRDAPPSEYSYVTQSEYSYVSESWASVSNTISFDQEDFEAFLLQEHEKGNLTESSYIFMNRGDEDSQTSIGFCSPLDPLSRRKSDPNFFGNIEGFKFFDVLDLEDISVEKTINTKDDESVKETDDGNLEPSESANVTDEGGLEQAESAKVAVEGKLEHSESAMETIEVKLEETETCEKADGIYGLVISRTECPPKNEARKQDAEPATSNAIKRNSKKRVGYINGNKAKVRASEKEGSLVRFLPIRKNRNSTTKPPKRFLATLQKEKKNQIIVEIVDEIDAVEICTNTTSSINNTTTKIHEDEVCRNVPGDEGNANSNYSIVEINSLLRAVASLKLSLERYDQRIKSKSDEGAHSVAVADAASYGENEISEDNMAETSTTSSLSRVSDEIVGRIQSGLFFLQSSLGRCSEIFTSNFCICADWELDGADDGTSSLVGVGSFSENSSDEC